jgi:hypothetical protein
MDRIYQNIKEKINNNDFLFIVLKTIQAYVLYFLNKITNYQLEKTIFYNQLGYPLDLKNPQSYNQKLVWKKIHDRNPLLTITADKYKVRSYIKKVLGEKNAKEILIPLLYVTDQPESIPFEKLPSAFIVKPNYASGLYIMVENSNFNQKEIIKICQRWLKNSYGLDKLEWAYRYIKRKIIIEKLLHEDDGKIPKDFRFHMFHGKCNLIHIVFDRFGSHKKAFFKPDWKMLDVTHNDSEKSTYINSPKNLSKMIKIAEMLSKPFDYVRVDLYNLNRKIYFGELTHYPNSGRGLFAPQSFDFELGKYWKIKEEYWKIK